MTLSKTLFSAAAFAALAGVSSAQFYTTNPIANNYTDISGSGTATTVISAGDDVGAPAALGFSFQFYDQLITAVNACSNGYLTTGPNLADFTPECIPANPGGTDPNGMIAPYWEDLSLDPTGDIIVDSVGGVCTIQWDNVAAFGGSTADYNFQAKLFQGANTIEFHYGTMNEGGPVDGSLAVIGVENEAGDEATQVSCFAAGALATGHVFVPPAVLPPALSAPDFACVGGAAVTFNPSGEPFHLYFLGAATTTVPTYSLFGASFDLVPNAYLITNIGSGLFGPTGAGTPVSVSLPASFPCGTIGYTQVASIGGFGPISGVQSSPLRETDITTCFTAVQDLPDPSNQTCDVYTMSALMDEVITMTLCRIGDQPDGSSLLDPRLCVYQVSVQDAFVGGSLGVVTNDDTLGDCFVTGPFGASIIEDWIVPATDTYQIACSNWDGTMGPYQLDVSGACSGGALITQTGDEVVGGCFL